MSEPILDCHHHDISQLVALRAMDRALRKQLNFLRYERKHGRRSWRWWNADQRTVLIRV